MPKYETKVVVYITVTDNSQEEAFKSTQDYAKDLNYREDDLVRIETIAFEKDETKLIE